MRFYAVMRFLYILHKAHGRHEICLLADTRDEKLDGGERKNKNNTYERENISRADADRKDVHIISTNNSTYISRTTLDDGETANENKR